MWVGKDKSFCCCWGGVAAPDNRRLPARAGPLRGCEGLLDLAGTLARSLEAQAADSATRAANAAAAAQLSAAMLRLGGDAAKANKLAKAYGVL